MSFLPRSIYVVLLAGIAAALSGCGGSSSTPAAVTTPVTAAAHYSVVALGLLPGFTSGSGAAINNSGQVVGLCQGESFNPDGTIEYTSHAFLYAGGALHDLGVPTGYVRSVGAGIDDAGDVLVNGENDDNGSGSPSPIDHPFLYHNGTFSSLALPAADVLAHGLISSNGHIGGVGQTAPNHFSPFLYANDSSKNLGVPAGYTSCDAAAINNNGDILGTAVAGNGTGASHAALYHAGTWADLGTLGPGGTSAGGLNDLGQATGGFGTNTSAHAFLYSQGQMKDIGVLPGYDSSEGTAVNNQGVVVGLCDGVAGNNAAPSHAFIYSKGQMQDLNTLIPAGSGWVLQSATAINSAGQITGNGLYYGQYEPFLLNPSS